MTSEHLTAGQGTSPGDSAGSTSADGEGGRVRRLRWIVPAVLLLIWLAVASIGGPYSGKLSEVQRNDTSSFLPANAESTKVLNEQAAFSSAQTFPAFVLLESDT
ncbi:MAG: hypothetical protein ACXV3S_12305, partial [Kineosporiaceae bacterium]